MSTFIPSLGALKSEIDTPALLIDLEALDRNITRMAGYFVDSGVRLRPHAKTHKSVEIARKQIAASDSALTLSAWSTATASLTRLANCTSRAILSGPTI